jgi:protein-S-isoprenylcysteine O-methyltransferase Ste14
MEGNGQPDVTSMVRAGTVPYWQAWVYLAMFFGASGLTTIYITRNDPGLLEGRMRGGPPAEKRPAQRVIMASPYWVSLPFSRFPRSTIVRVVRGADLCCPGRRRLLREQLAGYSGYQQRVRHRLLPGIW